MFVQATIPIQDEKTFGEVKQAIEESLAPSRVARFLRQVAASRLRVRQFEAVLANGFLGQPAQKSYAALGDADRGQIREQYLRKVEQVAPEVRQKFFKVYALY